MDLARFFETTLTDCDAGLAVRLLAIPVDSLAPHARSGVFDWPNLLGVREIARLMSLPEVEMSLASLSGVTSPEQRAAAQELAAEALEQELPIGKGLAVSLRALLGHRTGGTRPYTALGAVGDDMLLLLTSADWIVLFSTAAQLSAALANGLAVRVREAMGLDGRRFRSTGPASVSS
jgi:hypothetical protein